jgi:hypothetical protein
MFTTGNLGKGDFNVYRMFVEAATKSPDYKPNQRLVIFDDIS